MNYFMLCWSNEGFESIIDVTEGHPDNLGMVRAMAKLAGDPEPDDWVGKMAYQLRMRAQFNPQRYYEGYLIGADEGITEDDLRDWAEMDPQSLVDFSREKHYYKFMDTRPSRKSDVIV